VFVEERSPAGSFVQAIPMNTTGIDALTASGTATAEGQLQRSADGMRLTVPGYSADVGTAGVATTSSATNPRTVAVIDVSGSISGTIDLTASPTNPYSTGSIRSVISSDGTNFWSAGSGGTNTGAQYFNSASAAVQLNSTVTTLRCVEIYGGQLYVSSSTASFVGINAFGSGLPSTGGQSVTLAINTNGTGTGTASPYGFFLADLDGGIPGFDTAWIADDRTPANGGGIQRWSFDGTNWSLAYTLSVGTTGARGLAVDITGTSPLLYATTADGLRLVGIEDQGASSAFSLLATAPTNQVFRGLDFAPIPEPGAGALLLGGTAVLGLLRRRRG
jgi:hypothetical protein